MDIVLRNRILKYFAKRDGLTLQALRGLGERANPRMPAFDIECEVDAMIKDGTLAITNGTLWLRGRPQKPKERKPHVPKPAHPRQTRMF